MKKQKHVFVIILLLVIVMLIVWAYLQKDDQEGTERSGNNELVFRMAVNGYAEHPSRQASQLFADLVEERTMGSVKILLYDENQIGNETNITEQIEFGGIDFATVSSLYLFEYADEMKVLLLPYMFKTEEDMMNALNTDSVAGLLNESFKIEKINILAWYQGAKRGIFYHSVEINDLLGKKIRVPESQLKINELSAIGFLPVPAKVEEVNNYFKSDYIEGAEGDLLAYYYHSTNNVAEHFTFIPWSMVPEVIIASNTAMKQLTIEQQQIIAKAAEESAQYERRQIKIKQEKVMAELEEKGVVFYEAEPMVLDAEPSTFENIKKDIDCKTEENIRQMIKMVVNNEK